MLPKDAVTDAPAQPASSNPPPKQPVSERKLQANRRNALRSTGPKTERGKRTVARNAIKLGFLAEEAVITAGDGKESLEEFSDLVKDLHEYYEPVGIVEQLLLQTIAACWWRKARLIRAENGEIRKRLDTVAMELSVRNMNKGDLAVALTGVKSTTVIGLNGSAIEEWSSLQRLQSDLVGSLFGLEFLQVILLEAKDGIAKNGQLSEFQRNGICSRVSTWDYGLVEACHRAVDLPKRVEGQSSVEVSDPEADRDRVEFVKLIDSRLEWIEKRKEHEKVSETLALSAEKRSFSLPPSDATDKLLRYEAHLDRQLYRAMDQLERLQRQRRGENVPPPLNVNLERRR